MDPMIQAVLNIAQKEYFWVLLIGVIGLALFLKGAHDWRYTKTVFGIPPQSVLENYEPSIREGGQQILAILDKAKSKMLVGRVLIAVAVTAALCLLFNDLA